MSFPSVRHVLFLAAASLVIAGCGQSAPAPAPTSPPSAKAAEPTKAAAPAAPTAAPAAATKAPAAQPTTAPATQASAFPEKGKTITLIVPYAAGGGTDTNARFLAAALEKELGTPVSVVNKAGAASQVGMTDVFNAKPDGYTLGAAVLPVVISHYVDTSRNAPYKSMQDFTLIGNFWTSDMTISVQKDGPYKNLKDFLDAAKAKPGEIKISDSGLLGTPHLEVLLLEKVAGVTFGSVHFDGGAPSVTALLGGHVDAVAGGVSDASGQVKANTVTVLGVAADVPSEYLPGVPTFKSQGLDLVIASAGGIVAPKGTPKDVVTVISSAMQKIMATDDMKKKQADFGQVARYLNPEQYAAFWQDYEARVGPIFKEQATKTK